MNQPAYSNTGGLSRDDPKQERKTFGWKPQYHPISGTSVGNPPPAFQRSNPQSPNGYNSNIRKSPTQKPMLSVNRNSKREGNVLPTSPNLTPVTKEMMHHAKRERSAEASPPPASPASPHSRTIRSTPVKTNRTVTQPHTPAKRNENTVVTSPEVGIKKITTEPTVPSQPEEEVLSPELKEKLMSSDFIGLTIKPEICALEQCLQPLQEMEVICSEGAVMKVKNPTTKLEERNLELDVIVENAHNVLLKVISMYKE